MGASFTILRIMFFVVGKNILTGLIRISSNLSEGTKEAAGQSEIVVIGTDDMNSEMNSVSAASQQAFTNVNFISTAIAEILASVEEEARQTQKAQEITNHAVILAVSSPEKVNALGVQQLKIKIISVQYRSRETIPLQKFKE